MKDVGTGPYIPFARYRFDESVSLDFTHSHESIGVQVADVIAGANVRYYRCILIQQLSRQQFRER